MRCAGLALLGGLGLVGCGGDAGNLLTRRSADLPQPGRAIRDAGTQADAAPEPPPSRDPPEPPFVDPGCPPASDLPSINECDPLAAASGCPQGESCFPYVDYPSGPCEVERYGTICLPAGPGTQGDSCANQACAADHICVSTGRGTQCARLCGLELDAPRVCAPGLLCLPIDIEGFGGCL
jgi:hypothetical protein